MPVEDYDVKETDIAWCPGCGNFNILKGLKRALSELSVDSRKLVLVSGIGQAAKLPHYLKCNLFNGLHGRAIPAATAIKASNPQLTVIAVSGDGCMYGEGGNHLLHAIRRNPDITVIVHNNMVYGLTKGQASPTSLKGFKTPVQVEGVFNDPLNPLSLAISQGAAFVARGFAGDIDLTSGIIEEAINHRGFSLVDILQPCVSFNKLNTFKWFKKHTYHLQKEHDPEDLMEAFRRSTEKEKLPLGIFYLRREVRTFEENATFDNTAIPLYQHEVDPEKLAKLMEGK